jgi:hypothetical protein
VSIRVYKITNGAKANVVESSPVTMTSSYYERMEYDLTEVSMPKQDKDFTNLAYIYQSLHSSNNDAMRCY